MITRSMTKTMTMAKTNDFIPHTCIDSITVTIVIEYIDHYNGCVVFINAMNAKMKSNTIRHLNFPSEISENITKFAYFKKYGNMPSWDTDKGDLTLRKPGDRLLRFEVKGSLDLINGGPSSFGPSEEWDSIFFVDAKGTLEKVYTVYEIRVSNHSDLWKGLQVSSKQTFSDQCVEGRRPRMKFQNIINQLPIDKWSIIFNGSIYDL
jgi:hypothetical protein